MCLNLEKIKEYFKNKEYKIYNNTLDFFHWSIMLYKHHVVICYVCRTSKNDKEVRKIEVCASDTDAIIEKIEYYEVEIQKIISISNNTSQL